MYEVVQSDKSFQGEANQAALAKGSSFVSMALYERLSPALQGIMQVKSLLGPYCKSLLPQVLVLIPLLPDKGRVWSASIIQAAENTLRGLSLTDKQGVCAENVQHTLACLVVQKYPQVAQALVVACTAPGSTLARFVCLALQLRLAVYTNNATLWRTVMKDIQAQSVGLHHHPFDGQFAATDFDATWFATRLLPMRQQLFVNKIRPLLWEGNQPPALHVVLAGQNALPSIVTPATANGTNDLALPVMQGNTDVLLFHILGGRFEVAKAGLALFEQVIDPTAPLHGGMIAFFQGHTAPALMLLREGLKRYRKLVGRRKAFLAGPEGLCCMLALLQSHDVGVHAEIRANLDELVCMGSSLSASFVAIEALFELVQGREAIARTRLRQMRELTLCTPLARFVALLADVLIEPESAMTPSEARARRDKVLHLYAVCCETLPLVAAFCARILHYLGEKLPAKLVEPVEFVVPAGLPVPADSADFDPTLWNPLTLVERCETWERTFDQVVEVVRSFETAQSKDKKGKGYRLIWLYDHVDGSVEAVEQTCRANGQWTAGRSASLRRLCVQGNALTWLTPHDRRVLATVQCASSWRGLGYFFDMGATLPALVGHPLLFDARERTPINFEEGQVELCVHQTEQGYSLAFSHPVFGTEPVVEAVSPGLYRVGKVSPPMAQLAELLGHTGLQVPHRGADRVLALLEQLQSTSLGATIPVKANMPAVDVPEVSTRPVVQLCPIKGGTGLAIQVMVRPFDNASLCVPAGEGHAEPLTVIGGVLYRARRDVPGERAAVVALIKACPTLYARLYEEAPSGLEAHSIAANSIAVRKIDSNTMVPDHDAWARLRCREPWLVDELPEALAVLEELHQCNAQVEWPEGEQVRLAGGAVPVTAKALSLRVRNNNEWFQVQGDIQINENLVVDMGRLLERLEPDQGRFVPLGEGLYVALTHDFRRHLERLKALTEAPRAEKNSRASEPLPVQRTIHPLGVEAVQALLDEAGCAIADESWTFRLARAREAAAMTPTVPSLLCADLRDYQREGFAWMIRLARWGAGACLADDMGLGKTVQTIAVMLHETQVQHESRVQGEKLADHPDAGPCLVVAPTSVCHNWEAELARFAPSLRVSRLSAGGRKATVERLGPGDVLIVSYGLLHGESALLAARRWCMVVFDEAQALKNAATKRARAGKQINAAFRVALTGTPIENDLEDLWSLFNTINPGLLGSREAFQKRFAGPISQGQDEARQALKALVKPFILRRTKGAVLTELPPRTEQTLTVELPDDERALYEALRRKALENIAEQVAENPGARAGQRKMHILAELTRLRRACCHPSLIDPLTRLPGAKLEALMELVREVVHGQHKALVFSQFVGHLNVVRQALDQAGFPYHYLDGSTPERERRQLVTAFQGGEKDLFLISLRAGGQGLNLTEADCVIHLDPWWNPAVEDQASDRAYRMGQTRPVSIYRLIVGNSVEEKILRLHAAKRDLAADFLEGADGGGSLSEDELLDLLQQ